MSKILNYLKSLFKREKKYYVRIDNSGASTAENMLEYFLSPEGQKQLKELKEFAEKHKIEVKEMKLFKICFQLWKDLMKYDGSDKEWDLIDYQNIFWDYLNYSHIIRDWK